ncbi:clusterin-like isoform X2 [Rhinatrema bivittatum]|uniref:clusterin-like isoform X2 n=1 Tax=Rhinatrema bivittatum TaxID=194408 RepID=UPI00112D4665|nr:clusterin-like isoform X2 [Rhinatrema bivittatum]
MECDINNMFQESMKACGQMLSLCNPCFTGHDKETMSPSRVPSSFQNHPVTESRSDKRHRTSSQQDFHGSCHNLCEMTQKMLEEINQFMESPGTSQNTQDRFAGSYQETGEPGAKNRGMLSENENTTDNRMICCWEMCHHSADCPKRSEKYEKQKEIKSVDQPGKSNFQEEFEDSMRLAEKLTSQCEDLLQKLQKEMLTTTHLLNELNEQFESASKAAKKTENSSEVFKMTTVFSSTTADKNSSDTTLTMQLFDSNPNTTGPGDISREDSKFRKPVAQEGPKCSMKGVLLTYLPALGCWFVVLLSS